LHDALAVLEQVLSKAEYLVGGQFSAADVLAGYILMWFPRELTKYPSLKAYVRRLANRPAYQRSRETEAA
jgi:glutathione S-transferase